MKEEEKRTNIYKTLPDIFELIGKMEQHFPVDSIELSDGTKLWNLIRVILYFNTQKQDVNAKAEKISLKTLFYLFKEGFLPFNLSHKKITICGFSGTESRKFRDGKFYDIYMDPFYEMLGDSFFVFEWPTPAGYRRDYRGKIYSKNYVPMHIPVFSKTFFNLGIYTLLKRKKFTIKSEMILQDIISCFSKNTRINEYKLMREIYDAIAVFFYLKEFFVKLLVNIQPKAVLIRCGYGRVHMALSQACRELSIPAVELQHGIITKYGAGYVKSTESDNRDCVPVYLLTYGDAFTDIVRKGNLFNREKVITVGFPYIEELKEAPPSVDNRLKDFISKFSVNLLITSQWIVADEIKTFIIEMSKELGGNIGIVYKPHPRDWRTYTDMRKYGNIFLTNKYDDIYEILKVVDIHSTVYSTTAIEALAFGKPNIFIDLVGKTNIREIIDIVDNRTSFMTVSPPQFIETLEYIISNYESVSRAALKTSEAFFKPNAKKNFENFLNSIGIRI